VGEHERRQAPPGPRVLLRPADTGWFAAFDALAAAPGGAVAYAADAFRFWGSTFDASGLYRFVAAMDWLASTGTRVSDIHRHSLAMQKHFLDGLHRLRLRELPAESLVPPATVARGNFLALDIDRAEDVHRRISAQNVAIDRRDRRLRFGFGVYHDAEQVESLLRRLEATLE